MGTTPLEPYRFGLDRCLWPPDRDDVQCGKRVADTAVMEAQMKGDDDA